MSHLRLSLESLESRRLLAMLAPAFVTDVASSASTAPLSFRLTELHFNPADPTPAELAIDGTLDNDDFEFMEFQNTGNVPINTEDILINIGMPFTLPAATIMPGDFALVVRDQAAFEIRYGTGLPVIAENSLNDLSNAGQPVAVVSANGDTIHAFFYSDDDNWPSFADGHGESMEVIDTSGDYGDPLNWLPSRNVNGSPGLADLRGTSASPLRLTEIMYNPVATSGAEFLEFYNSGSSSLDLSGFQVIEGVEFEFSLGFSTTLDAGERTSIVGSISQFRSTYGPEPKVTGVYSSNLANEGERLIVVDEQGDIIHDFVYDDDAPWPTLADGQGRSLQIVNANGDYNDATNWMASELVGGSPSAAETISGDFNDDGSWDCVDIDQLSASVAAMNHDLSFDLTGDGLVDLADIDAWLVEGGQMNSAATGGNAFLVGDADLSGEVDGVDFLIWNNNKFTSNSHWCDGNFDGNPSIDGTDFILWNDNKFQSSC